MPLYWIDKHLAEIPRLRAEEKSDLIEASLAPHMTKQSLRDLLARVRAAFGMESRRAKTIDEIAAANIGIGVRRVAKSR